MSLQDAVARAFDSDGVLARCVEEFAPRGGQTTMALAVASTLETGGILVVEAGTGVGKTFAYLVPALLSGERVLLSTATKTLQNQLFGRDIPRLIAALGLPVRTALLKGRSSYLCLHRLSEARHHEAAQTTAAQRDLAHVEVWALTTRAGDLAEISHFDERSPVIPLVTSTRENCLGARCPQIQNCHVNRARREAMNADVIVINHHLFFADLNIRESGVAELLPSVHSVVFDEAHQLNEIGVQFLGRQLTTQQLESFAQDFGVHGPTMVLAYSDWPALQAEMLRRIRTLRTVCGGDGKSVVRRAWLGDAPDGVDSYSWQHAVSSVHDVLQHTEVLLRSIEDLSPALAGLQERASRLMAELDVFSHAVEAGGVRWLETGRQIKLLQSPLDIAQAMRSRVIATPSDAERNKSWIFTSATLGHDATLAHFVQACGLQGAQILQVQSPFDYALQATLYIPEHMPKPSEATHSAAVARLASLGARVLGGRTLVLTTTLRAMRDIAAFLRAEFTPLLGIDVLLQGESPKHELTQRLVRGAAEGANGCILVGSASFWEGIDVPGHALQLVVIDKLPFSPPGDPVVDARARQLEAEGRNPFHHFHVPQAAIALKQGAGRLIRRESDRGILAVCDVRLTQMGYGRRILAALPAMQRVTSEGQYICALEALTRPSTTDH